MKDKKDDNIRLKELFMAKAGIGNKGFDRCFHGTIRRETDADGNPICYSKINIDDGYVCSMGKDQWVLGNRLDELVLLVLDYDIHSQPITASICNELYYLN
jgi:hypothetical protein